MKPLARLLVPLAALAFAAGPIADSASAMSSTPVYTQADSGTTVHPGIGTKFKIRLKVCEDCGNYWKFAQKPDAAVLKLVRHTDVSSATPPAVGGINTETWTYKVVGQGNTQIKLAQHSASQNQKVVKHFSLNVQVLGLARTG